MEIGQSHDDRSK